MHDLVRDCGRKIFGAENIERPKDKSRLSFLNMVLERVRTLKGIVNVVPLALWGLRHNLRREDFVNFMNAWSFKLNGGNFPSKANNRELNHLIVLKLSSDMTTEEWSTWVEIMVTIKLKVLYITGSKSSTKTFHFSEFMSLERLILKDFPSLVEIDRSIGRLKRLICLKIKCCPLLRELPQEIGCLTALRELLLIQCFSVCYLPDSISYLRHLSRLVMDDTGLVELPDTIKGLVDLEHLCLANCRSLNSLSDAVGELKSLTHLDLSRTTIGELPPSLWNIQVLTLRINDSKIETQVMRYRPLMQDLEDRLDHEELEPDGPFKSAKFSVSLPSYPMDILSQEWRKIVAPGFHEHHLSGRCPPKILASVIFPHGDDSWINIAAEIPLWDTGIMSSSQPIQYFKNLILMFVSWLERKWVSKWMHDFQRQDEELLSLEFCGHCMSITSVIREFSDSPLLNSFHRFAQISIFVSMTLYEPGHNDQIGCRVKNLEILTKFSSPILRSANLLLQCPLSKETLPGYITMWDSWHEEATQIQGSVYTRSIKNCMSQRQRKTRGGRLRAKRKRNLTWLCLHNYLDKHLLTFTVDICACCCILSPFIKTKLDYYNVLEEACLLFDSALDVKQKARLAREFNRVWYWLTEIVNIEMSEEDYSLFCKDMYNLLLHWYRRNRRRGHHHKTFDTDFFKLTEW